MKKGTLFLAILFYAFIIGIIFFIVREELNDKNNNEEESTINSTSNDTALDKLDVGEIIQIDLNKYKNNENDNISIYSENETIATVESNGTVNAISSGKTKIIVKNENGEVSSLDINVTEKPKEEVSIPSNKDADKSKDNNIVNQEKTTTEPVKEETPPAKNNNSNQVINDIAVSSINFDKNSLSLYVGDVANLKANILPANATNKTIHWSSSNDSIVKVDNNGQIQALKEGSVVIKATSNNNITGSISISVNKKAIEVTSITVDSNINLNTAESYKINASVSPSNATDKTLKYTSSNTSVATVDNNGNIKGLSSGSATITVSSSNNITKTINVKVKSVERIHFIPVMANINDTGGHGDSILLESNGHFAMVDTGYSSEISRKNLITYLNKLGVKKLDFILITHLHSDHYGGLNYLLKKGIKVDTLYIKRYSEALGEGYATTYTNILNCANGKTDGCTKVSNVVFTQTIDKSSCPEKSNQAHSDFNCTANISLQNMKIKLYNTAYVMKDGDIGPNGKYYISNKKKDGKYETININYESIYEYITVNNHKIVLAADAIGEYSGTSNPLFTSDGWYNQILKDAGTKIDVLKAPHHGDLNSDKNFSKLKPKSLVVTNTKNKLSNKVGIQDYESIGSRIYYVEYYSNTNDLKTLYADFTGTNVDFGRIKIYSE